MRDGTPTGSAANGRYFLRSTPTTPSSYRRGPHRLAEVLAVAGFPLRHCRALYDALNSPCPDTDGARHGVDSVTLLEFA